jgi:hypothetical protein
MPNMVDKDRAEFIKSVQDEKAQYERELRADPSDKAAKMNLERVNKVLERYGVQVANEDNSKMKDGGMAYGRGSKQYKHNYATGGSVVDHLSKPTGHPMGGQPQSVQAMTATAGETPAQRSKRLRSGG